MGNWYNNSNTKQRITILPRVKQRMETMGWLDQLTEALKDIKPVNESGIYRISLEESFGGKDFNLKVRVSPKGVEIVDLVTVELEAPIKLLD